MKNSSRIPDAEAQSLVEFALILPIIVLFIIGIFDLGFAVYTRNILASAAREGARTGIIMANNDAMIQTRVKAAAPGLNLQNSQISIVPSPSRSFSNPITVTVSYTYTTITPFLGQVVGNGGKVPLSGRSVMIVEGVQ